MLIRWNQLSLDRRPEQRAEDDNGPHLDGKVTDDDLIPGGEAERHHEET